jgi:hypothetical protein
MHQVAKWLQIFVVALLFVALYCGDLHPPAMRSTAVFQGLSTQVTKLSEAAASYVKVKVDVKAIKGTLATRPVLRRFGFTKAWNTVTDTMPAQYVVSWVLGVVVG